MKSPLVAVVEPWADGHRANYVRLIARALVARGNRVAVVTSADGFRDPIMREVEAMPGVEVLLHEISRSKGPVAPGAVRLFIGEVLLWLRLRAMAQAARKHFGAVSCCVLPYVDYCYHALAMLGSPLRQVPWVGITMRTSVDCSNRAQSLRERFLGRVASPGCMATLFTIDPRIQECASGTLPERLRYLPDPVELRAAGGSAVTRASLGVREVDYLVLVLGSIDDRKGVAQLLAALPALPAQPRVVVLVAGRVLPRARTVLSGSPGRELLQQGRLIVVDRRLQDEEIADLLAAADCAWLGYSGHEHMSGILLLAAVAGVPIIATQRGAIGYLAGKMSEAILVDPNDVDQVGGALRRLGQGARRRRPEVERNSWMEAHRPERFASAIAGAVQAAEAESKPGSPGRQKGSKT
jgi:glycosyltransferase involved in cell wall biosynthesis